MEKSEKRVVIAGANGYVGSRLAYRLAEKGIEVIALVRNKQRFTIHTNIHKNIEVIECDFLDKASLEKIPTSISIAYYLVHSMSEKEKNFSELEERSVTNFLEAMRIRGPEKIVYLSGLSGKNAVSDHMKSRDKVGEILNAGPVPIINFQAGIIIGSGSASFEIIRDIVEKLPVMIAPKWVSSKCQPIGIFDVLYYLESIHDIGVESGTYQIGGPDVLTYKQMLLIFAKIRHLKRWIISIPLLTPNLSSKWLYFVTSTNLYLAKRLVNSLTNDAVCTEFKINQILPHKCLSYEEAIKLAFDKIEQNHVLSSWKDALNQSSLNPRFDDYIHVPTHGCLKNIQIGIYHSTKKKVIDRLWAIGGKNGWYYMDWAWRIRGKIDKFAGGVGLRRGRKSPTELEKGGSLDFWRVIKSDKVEGHLLLYAEMKLPGEAWLEWKITEVNNLVQITQTATFRPKGVLGRLYWYALIPFHLFIFKGMCNKIGGT